MSKAKNPEVNLIAKQAKEGQIAQFDEQASYWHQQTPKHTLDCIDFLINKFNISDQHTILDIAAGTGVWLQRMHELQIYPNYIAIDISSQMIQQLNTRFPDIEAHCADIEDQLQLHHTFDWVVVFNGTPHIQNLNRLFENATKHLQPGGKLLIAHARTRAELKEHHKRIGYSPFLNLFRVRHTYVSYLLHMV